MTVTIDQIVAYLEHRNREQSRNGRGEFRDDIMGWVADALCDIDNSEARLVLSYLSSDKPQQLYMLFRDKLIATYGEKALEFSREREAA